MGSGCIYTGPRAQEQTSSHRGGNLVVTSFALAWEVRSIASAPPDRQHSLRVAGGRDTGGLVTAGLGTVPELLPGGPAPSLSWRLGRHLVPSSSSGRSIPSFHLLHLKEGRLCMESFAGELARPPRHRHCALARPGWPRDAGPTAAAPRGSQNAPSGETGPASRESTLTP